MFLRFNEVFFPFEIENGLFVWKASPCYNENCFNADSLQIWHAKMRQNNFNDLTLARIFGGDENR